MMASKVQRPWKSKTTTAMVASHGGGSELPSRGHYETDRTGANRRRWRYRPSLCVMTNNAGDRRGRQSNKCVSSQARLATDSAVAVAVQGRRHIDPQPAHAVITDDTGRRRATMKPTALHSQPQSRTSAPTDGEIGQRTIRQGRVAGRRWQEMPPLGEKRRQTVYEGDRQSKLSARRRATDCAPREKAPRVN